MFTWKMKREEFGKDEPHLIGETAKVIQRNQLKMCFPAEHTADDDDKQMGMDLFSISWAHSHLLSF